MGRRSRGKKRKSVARAISAFAIPFRASRSIHDRGFTSRSSRRGEENRLARHRLIEIDGGDRHAARSRIGEDVLAPRDTRGENSARPSENRGKRQQLVSLRDASARETHRRSPRNGNESSVGAISAAIERKGHPRRSPRIAGATTYVHVHVSPRE